MEIIEYSSLEVNKSPAIKFPNNEVFISIIEIEIESKILRIMIPKEISKINIPGVKSSNNEFGIAHFQSWLENNIGLKPNTIYATPSVSFMTNKNSKDNLWSSNVRMNTEIEYAIENHPLSEIFNSKMQIVAGYFNEDRIISLATDNGNGSVTILTSDNHECNGYATECLSRLIHEYNNKGLLLGFGTEGDNYGAIRVAEKCGLELTANGYWFRINPSEFLENKEILNGLLEE